MMGAGLWGTVTAAAADQYTIKTDAGDVYTVHFSAETRILKMPAFVRRDGGQGNGGGQGSAQGAGQGNGGGQGGRRERDRRRSRDDSSWFRRLLGAAS